MDDRAPADDELLRRFVAGDADAFETLLRRHEDRVFAIALRMMGQRADALDAAQEALITAFRKAAGFRGEAAFGTWLYRITINTCHDLLRKRQRSGEPHADVPERPAPAAAVDDSVATRIDVSRALARLPAEYREAVVLHDLGGVPYDEIARMTGTNIGTVKSRISRGRRRLAAILELPERPAVSKEKT